MLKFGNNLGKIPLANYTFSKISPAEENPHPTHALNDTEIFHQHDRIFALDPFTIVLYQHDKGGSPNGYTNTIKAIPWFDYLHYNVRLRLAQCHTVKSDLSILLDAKWRWAQYTGHYNVYTKEYILSDILDLLDCNDLNSVTELTMEGWRNLIK